MPISPGELLDKITILRIKSARMTDAGQAGKRPARTGAAGADLGACGADAAPLAAEEHALEAVNARLWDIEDRIREHEAGHRFDASFIELARAVYVTNDERAAIKKRINVALGSKIVEEKSYQPYD